MLHDVPCTLVEVIKKLMNHEVPMIPDIYMPSCDVRIVAEAHIKAMTLPEANNQRHIIVTTTECNSFRDWALILDAEFRNKRYSIPTMVAPNFMIKIFSIFDKQTQLICPMLGIKSSFDNSRLLDVLKIEQISIENTVTDMAYSLIEKGIVKKK